MNKIMAIMFSVLMLAGCNTVRGVGQDIEKAGEAVQKSTQ